MINRMRRRNGSVIHRVVMQRTDDRSSMMTMTTTMPYFSNLPSWLLFRSLCEWWLCWVKLWRAGLLRHSSSLSGGAQRRASREMW